jgi:predicted DNA-binding transcriptional regulator YafY
VDLSWIVDGEWREKEQEFVVRRATLEGKDMGRIDLTATLANVSPLVFSPSPIVARAAALSVLARQLDASLENVSLVDRTIDLEAKSKGVDPAKLRADYATSAEALVLAFFDGSEKARPIAAAIAKFVASPRQLRLRLQSAKGIGVFDALTSKPSEILRSADVEAKTAP